MASIESEERAGAGKDEVLGIAPVVIAPLLIIIIRLDRRRFPVTCRGVSFLGAKTTK